MPPPDTRDAEEHAAIAEILAELPAGHVARIAYEAGADTIRLAHLVDRRDLAQRLTDAHVAGYNRMLRRHGHFRP